MVNEITDLEFGINSLIHLLNIIDNWLRNGHYTAIQNPGTALVERKTFATYMWIYIYIE